MSGVSLLRCRMDGMTFSRRISGPGLIFDGQAKKGR